MPPREEGGHVWGEEAEQPEGREAAGWPRGTVQRTDTPQRPAVSGREAQCGVGAPLLLPPVLQAAICGSICDLKSTCRITTRPPPGHAAHTGGCVGWLAQGASWTHALGTMPWLPGLSRWRCCAWWASTMSAGPQAPAASVAGAPQLPSPHPQAVHGGLASARLRLQSAGWDHGAPLRRATPGRQRCWRVRLPFCMRVC